MHYYLPTSRPHENVSFHFCSDKQLITILIYDRRNTIFIQVTANDTGQIIGRFIGAVSRTDVYLYRGYLA